MQQDRVLVITNTSIYNFKKNEAKRKIDISKMIGLTKSISEGHGEFVMHSKNEYDYRMRSEARDQILDVIKRVYYSINNANLPIYGVKPKSLVEFTTSIKDMKKGISRIPLEMARLKNEDILQSNTPGTVEKDDEFDFNQQMDERGNAYINNHLPAMEIDKEASAILKGREKSFTWYQK